MRSAARAIVWEIWGANRRGFILIGAAIPACALISQILISMTRRENLVRSFGFVPMVLSLLFVFVFFNYTESDRRGRFGGFPARLFALPARTLLLVTCPILLAAATVAMLYGIWARLVFGSMGTALPLAWPVVLLVTGMVCYQAIIWGMAGCRLTRLIALGLLGTGWIGVACLPNVYAGVISWPLQSVLMVALVAVSLAAYGGAVIAVDRQRSGGGTAQGWWRKQMDLVLDGLPRRRQSNFTSSAQAHFWFEWRRNGLVLPFCVAAVLMLIVGPISWFVPMDHETTLITLLWIFALPIALATLIGRGFGTPDFWSGQLSLAPFVAIRPITTGKLILTKLKVAAVSVVISWALVLIITPLWLAAYADLSGPLEIWDLFQRQYSPAILGLMVPLTVIALLTLTWKLMVGGLLLGLWGRPKILTGFICLTLGAFLAVVAFLIWLGSAPDSEQALSDVGTSLKGVFEQIPLLVWMINFVFIAKVFTAAWTWQEGCRRYLLTARALRRYLALWLAGTGVWVALAWLVFSPAEATAFGFPLVLFIHADWAKHLAILGALLMFPLARVGLSPLTLQWNRHR